MKAMKYSKQRVITEALYASDLTALVIALVVSIVSTSAIQMQFSIVDFFLMRFSLINMLALTVLMLVWVFVFRQNGLYERHSSNIFGDIVPIGFATAIGTAVIAIGNEIYDISAIHEGFITWFWGMSLVTTWALRTLLRNSLEWIHLGDNNITHVLIVGTNSHAQEIAADLRRDPMNCFEVLGFVNVEERGGVGNALKAEENISSLVDARELLSNQVIDELVVTLSLRDITTQVEDLMSHAAQLGIAVRCPAKKLFSGVFGHEVARLMTEQQRHASGSMETYLVLRSGYGFNWEYVLKRIVDYLGASLMLALLSPLMLMAAIAIKATSSGGVFFIQERYGYNGRIIRLFKFRTMAVDADAMQKQLREQHNEMDGGAFKMKNDPRVTAVGKLLRKTSVDELPQLLNVLRGEMSLVGPRPLPLSDYEHFQKTSHMRRLSVLPGITCTWQAGGRNNVSFDEWMDLDMAYIDNWSLTQDIKILLKTIPAVLFGRGAS